MYFDWITWGIWLTGFVILVLWIVIPLREFRTLLARRSADQKAAAASPAASSAISSAGGHE